jgi:hypothetical protein
MTTVIARAEEIGNQCSLTSHSDLSLWLHALLKVEVGVDIRIRYAEAAMDLKGGECMPSIGYRDAVGGALLVAVGAVFAIYSWIHYPLGSVTRMGAGMVPFSLGVLLAILGGMVFMTSLSREGSFTEIRVATPLVILASVVVFALVIIPFGLLPAAFLATLIAAFADLSFRPVRNVILAAVLSAVAYLIFAVGLQLPIPLFAWPL